MTPRLILIGPMGVGKSTLGMELAHRLGTSFLDTDEMVEGEAKKSVSEIFLDEGEERFRELESDALAQALDSDGIVALGGGACVAESAQAQLRNTKAPIVFLNISLSAISSRVGFDKARPLLAINPRSKWQELMEKRRPIYEGLATTTITVDGRTVDDLVTEIMELL